jgi:adenosine deaminase
MATRLCGGVGGPLAGGRAACRPEPPPMLSFRMPQPKPARAISLELIEKLPKTDLHVHLDGSLRLSTILDLAEKHKIELPADDAEGLRAAMHLGHGCGSLVEYLKAFDVTLRVMQTEESLRRIAYELGEDASRENVRYMEVRYAPMLHTRRGLKLTTVVESVLEGLREAQEKHGIESNVIICGIRNVSPEHSLEMAELAVAYKGRGVVGFDLAGAEYDHPAKHHKAAFQLVRDNNINVTIHAGEAYGPESIAQAIHVCGAHRIGHGCRLRENGDLLHYVNDHRIPLECCPSSNVQTGAIRDLASHPLKLYKNLGLRVTVNTDNRLITDTTVSKELWLCHTEMGLGLRDIKQIILSGYKSAFLPFHVKQQTLRKVSEELAAFPDDEPMGVHQASSPSVQLSS